MNPQANYQIIRMYQWGGRDNEILEDLQDLTLSQAQAHCRDPETSSSTCKSPLGHALTEKAGPWFDGYEEMK